MLIFFRGTAPVATPPTKQAEPIRPPPKIGKPIRPPLQIGKPIRNNLPLRQPIRTLGKTKPIRTIHRSLQPIQALQLFQKFRVTVVFQKVEWKQLWCIFAWRPELLDPTPSYQFIFNQVNQAILEINWKRGRQCPVLRKSDGGVDQNN